MTCPRDANGHPLPRPMPADFIMRRREIGDIKKLCRHYRAGTVTVQRWISEAGLPALKSKRFGHIAPNRKPLPEGFADVAPTMHKTALCRHYGATLETLNRWLVEAGVTAKRAENKPFVFTRAPGITNIAPSQAYGPEDWAADVLRKFYPVFRCNERGAGDHKGTFWRAGNTVLTGAELIQRAERKTPRAAGNQAV